MTWKQWTAVGVVIGVGIVAQIWADDVDAIREHATSSAAHTAAPARTGDEPRGPHRTIALEVAGMT